MTSKPIQVTRGIRPSFFRFIFYALKIINSRIFTNSGRFEKMLEKKLQERFNIDHVVLMANGTLPIQALLARIPKNKVIITTPFSFIATTSTVLYSNLEPLFVDIDLDTLLPSPTELEALLMTNDVGAVLVTQIYGRTDGCEKLEEVCREFNIPLYFDASHSFDVLSKEGGSAYALGHASTASFHATKVFSTAEGGALFTNDASLAEFARNWKNFGIVNGNIVSIGINAKMSELSAAFGLSVLPRLERDYLRRRQLAKYYEKELQSKQLRIVKSPNYSYFPLILPSNELMMRAVAMLNQEGIFPRRYFHPSLDEALELLGIPSKNCANSRSIASRVICLPMGDDVKRRTAKTIVRIINETFD